MKISAAGLFPLLLLLALAALSLWLEKAVRDEMRHPSLVRHDPDYIIERLTVTSFGPDGRVESTLSADKMVHYPDDDSTELVAPRVVQSKANQPRFRVSAARGELSQNGEEVFLFGDVLVVREAGAERPEARIQTEFLHLVHAKSLLRTDRQVSIVEDGRSFSGRGMEYNNETREFKLHDQVRGRFEPAASVRTQP